MTSPQERAREIAANIVSEVDAHFVSLTSIEDSVTHVASQLLAFRDEALEEAIAACRKRGYRERAEDVIFALKGTQ